MARDRQQAKQRQAERRARRLEQQGDGAAAPKEAPAPAEKDELGGLRPPPVEPPMMDPNLAVGAPPQDEGRSDTVIEDEPHIDDDDDDVHLTDDEVDAEAEAEAELAARGEDGFKVQGRRGADTHAHKNRPRVVQFLISVWAELQRVQWPDRQALTTLTGVVLGFVLIMGGYLGLLDAIFSALIKAIL